MSNEKKNEIFRKILKIRNIHFVVYEVLAFNV